MFSMSQSAQSLPSVFHIDVSAGAPAPAPGNLGLEMAILLRQLVQGQERTNQLLENVIGQMQVVHKQRATELGNWKEANPELAEGCRVAAESLTKAQTQYLQAITDEVNDQGENLADSEFMLNEFVDRFGPRLAHLNGVLHLLSQLGSVPQPVEAPQQ
jgi:hypothetical protein